MASMSTTDLQPVRKATSIRWDLALYEQLKQAAREDQRTIQGEVLYLIRQALTLRERNAIEKSKNGVGHII